MKRAAKAFRQASESVSLAILPIHRNYRVFISLRTLVTLFCARQEYKRLVFNPLRALLQNAGCGVPPRKPPLCFHNLTNSYSRMLFSFITLQIAGGCTPSQISDFRF